MTQKQELRFLLTDIEYKMFEGQQLVIRLYGKMKDAQVLVQVRDFLPYFYVKKDRDIEFIAQNDSTISKWQRGLEEVVLRKYFWAGEKVKLVKLFGSDPTKIELINHELEKMGLETFEADIPYAKRFLIDNNIKCLNVVVALATKVEQKGKEIFAEASYKDIYTASDLEIPSPVLFYKLKIMGISVKIARDNETIQELLERKNRPVIAISAVWGDSPKQEDGKLFLLQEYSEEGEKKLLMDFIKYLYEIQPDVLCTYQGDSFDLPYLFCRMQKLKIPTHLLSLFRDESSFYSRQLLCYRIPGRMSFDLALRTWGIHPASGKKGLYDVATEVLGRGKIDKTKEKSKQDYSTLATVHGEVCTAKIFWQLWQRAILEEERTSLSQLAKYCFYDAKIIFDLFWGLGMSGWIETLRVTGFPTAEANNCTERLNGEFELMRYMRRKGVLIPKRPDEKQVEKNRQIREMHPHEGGTVLYPKGSLHTGVLIADFQSMYPSVMIAQNIGGETIKQWIDASDFGDPKKLFDKESRSCLSIMEETLIKKRIQKKNEIKRLTKILEETTDQKEQRKIQNVITVLEQEQASMKIVANSMYGAHFYIRSRFYTQTLASAIADSARTYLLGIEEGLEEISKKITPCELIYGDTDSTFIKILDENLFSGIHGEKNLERKKERISKLMDTINAILKELNSKLPSPVELKFEDFAYRVIFKPDRKKAYSYVSLLTDEFTVKGFEAVRSDWSPLARTAQRKVLEILLKHPEKACNEKEVGKNTEFQTAKRFLISLGVKIFLMTTEELLPKVVIFTPICRAPENYNAKAPAVEAFKHFAQKEQLDISKEWMDYDKFPWIIVPGKGLVYDRARHPKYVEDIDREHYITEMLRCCEDLGVKVTLEEVEGALPIGRLDMLFEKAQEEKQITREERANQQEFFTTNGGFANDIGIQPVKADELMWKSKEKGIRRNVKRQRGAGQAALTMFSFPLEDDVDPKEN